MRIITYRFKIQRHGPPSREFNIDIQKGMYGETMKDDCGAPTLKQALYMACDAILKDQKEPL